MKKIILASTSPRRKEILKKLKIKFTIKKSPYEEDLNLKMPPSDLVKFLSLGKAQAIKNKDALVISGDTIVAYNNQVFGKPKTKKKAREMLNILSGKKHEIITGITIIDKKTNKTVSFSETTYVYMKKLTPRIIENYIKTKEPLDKAGAYALQDLGAILIEKMEGDFFNAAGLPLKRLSEELKNFGINIL